MSDNVVGLAARTVRALRENGWSQGDRVNYLDGSMCLIGALSFAATRDAFALMPFRGNERERHPEAMRLFDAMSSILREQGGVSNPMAWNDGWAQSVDEVIAVIQKADQRIKEEGRSS